MNTSPDVLADLQSPLAGGHIVSAFSDELAQLEATVLRMGGLAESMLTDAVSAVLAGNGPLGRSTAAKDPQVDRLEEDIERKIVRLIALRAPMGGDLRAALAAYKISSDIERIGDLSKNIARRAADIDDLRGQTPINGIGRLGKAVQRQLSAVLDCYGNKDADEALAICVRDDDIDEHYNSLFREALTYMMEDPRTIGNGAQIMFIVKHLERIGDHCTNIAESVFYTATGSYLTPHVLAAYRAGDDTPA